MMATKSKNSGLKKAGSGACNPMQNILSSGLLRMGKPTIC